MTKVYIPVIIISFYILCPFLIFSQTIHDYELHLNDLRNINSNGYRHSFNGIDIQGTVRMTSSSLDCAIIGYGFFRFSQPESNQFLYSRDGQFQVSNEGFLVNKDGFYLEPKIQFPADYISSSVSISESGLIKYKTINSSTVFEQYIRIYNRRSNEYAQKGNYFIFDSADIISNSRIICGALETSNFPVLTKLYSLLEILYQLHQKNPEHEANFAFKIRLIDELIQSYKEMMLHIAIGKYSDSTASDNLLNNFYREVRETADFLALTNSDKI